MTMQSGICVQTFRSVILSVTSTLNLILIIILICVAKFTTLTKNIISCKSPSFVLWKKRSLSSRSLNRPRLYLHHVYSNFLHNAHVNLWTSNLTATYASFVCEFLHTEASGIVIQRNILEHTEFYPATLKKNALYSFLPTRVRSDVPRKTTRLSVHCYFFFHIVPIFFYLVICDSSNVFALLLYILSRFYLICSSPY